jgi:ABC-type sulfate/molybdate transport systems ATPase subunit
LSYGDKEQIFQQPAIYEVARLTGCRNLSPIQILSPITVKALDWNCHLTISKPISEAATHIGIRAHHLLLEELEALKLKPKTTQNLSSPLELSDSILELSETSTISTATSTLNTFPCWLVQRTETLFRVTLYIKVNHPPENYNDYHFQVELFKENWNLLKEFPFPWHLRLDPQRLFLLTES